MLIGAGNGSDGATIANTGDICCRSNKVIKTGILNTFRTVFLKSFMIIDERNKIEVVSV